MLLSTASEYGARLAAPAGAAVRSGALDEASWRASSRTPTPSWTPRIPSPTVISARRPRPARACGRPYLRYERPAGELTEGDGRVLRAADAAQAARLAVERAGERPGVTAAPG